MIKVNKIIAKSLVERWIEDKISDIDFIKLIVDCVLSKRQEK